MTKKTKFSINWNRVMWKETLWLNFLRAICVTPVVLIFTALSNGEMITAILWPLNYFLMVPILLFLFRPLAFGILGPIANLLWIPMCLIFICGGDPIVFLISKIKPQLVPIQDFKFINLELFIFVEKPEKRRNGEEEMMDSDY